jgi:DNA-directed RNA polymerase specialized sigma24 family protein
VQSPNLNGAEVEHLYGQLGPALVLFALSITGDRARAQDAVHQVFLKMIEKPNLGEIADRKAYLYTCVRNAILNEAKTRQRSVALDEEVGWFEPPHRDYAAELNLRRALYLLPDDQREVVVLHVWESSLSCQLARFCASAQTLPPRDIDTPFPACVSRCLPRRTPVSNPSR